ncbi:hypothetical protein DM860_008493 [Cuscuta australis]|uniref:F-box domain-containing protein n=1 Tax=Cuscuta australis TaxID=267555 RepID=A0A328D540_9ASTE|nr:hypothetical protein DM860_008493 [Cuscuta australis]
MKGAGSLYFPEEIVINILKNLPAQSLVRFQLVCKSWRKIIKMPSFLTLHADHISGNHEGSILFHLQRERGLGLHFLEYQDMLVKELPDPFINIPNSLKEVGIACSSDGVVCLRCPKPPQTSHIYTENLSPPSLICWNPVLLDAALIPPAFTADFRGMFFVGLCFNPGSVDYKIVMIATDIGVLKIYRAQLYSSTSTGWKELSLDPLKVIKGLCMLRYHTVSTKGSMYWLGSHGKIIAFNTTSENFSLIDMPSGKLDPLSCRLSVFRTNLCMLFDSSYGRGEIEWWLRDSESWVEKSTKRPPALHLCPIDIGKHNMLCFLNAPRYDNQRSRVCSFMMLDLSTLSHKRFDVESKTFYVVQHIQTLLPVGGKKKRCKIWTC